MIEEHEYVYECFIVMIENECAIYNYAVDNPICFYVDNYNHVKHELEHVSTIMIDLFDNNFLLVNPSTFQAILFDKKIKYETYIKRKKTRSKHVQRHYVSTYIY